MSEEGYHWTFPKLTLHSDLIMAIQDTSNAIFETAVHTQKNLSTLFEKVTSKTVGM